jgi:hypothetical protein
VLDDTVTPRFAYRDEVGGDVEIETGGDDRTEVLPCRWDATTEVRMVVELSDRRHSNASPDARQHGDRHRWAGLGDDVVADPVRADIGQVHSVELGSTVQVPRADHVDLMDGSRLHRHSVRVGHVLGHVPLAAQPAGLGNSSSLENPLDRPRRRDRLDANPA